MATPRPTELVLHRAARTLEVAFEDGARFELPAEYLRVHSPSAELQGHGPGQKVLLGGRRQVGIVGIEPIGNYAVLLRFSDGHASGLYSWETLYQLGRDQESNWATYLRELEAAGLSRNP